MSTSQPYSAQPYLAQPAQPAQPVQPAQPAQPVQVQPGQPVQPVQVQPGQPVQPVYYYVSPQLQPSNTPQQLVYYQQPYPSVQSLPTNPPTYDQSLIKTQSPELQTSTIQQTTIQPSPVTAPLIAQPAPLYATAGVNNAKAPRFSCTMYCPFCKKNVNTMISYENNSMVWIIAIILFMCTIIFFFIPFLIKDLKDAIHYCPYCRREIARNEKSI